MSGSEDDEPTSDAKPNEEPEPFTVPSNYKTRGKISEADSTGVFGYNTSGSGTGTGVVGQVDSTRNGAEAIHGEASNTTGQADGVVGVTRGIGSTGSVFDQWATGVTGKATNSSGVHTYGVYGRNDGTGTGTAGVIGWSLSDDGEVYGVRGETNSDANGAAGVWGNSNDTSGATYGVKGTTSSAEGGAAGVHGFAQSTKGTVHGVFGQTNSDATGAAGLRGLAADSGSGFTYGVVGATNSNESSAAGVRGITSSTASGVEARSSSGTGLQVTGVNRHSSGDGDFPSQHSAIISDLENSYSRVLALKTGDDAPTDLDNFITFFASDNTAIGAIEGSGGNGISLNTSSADLGEYFPLADRDLDPEEGEVLGLEAGELSRDTSGAEAALVVTRSPAVLGNNPKAGQDEEPEGLESVALVGQVPVKVTESVEAGDRLVAAVDGTARVGDRDEGLSVGRALESVEVAAGEVETVRTFVGGPMSETPVSADEVDPQEVVESEYEEMIAELRRENERLSEENEELKSRLDDLEGTVETLVTDTGAASGPEAADD